MKEVEDKNMLQVETTGKNIEVAIENALLELKAVREDVDITILEEGGFFKKAKVFVKISEDCVSKYKKFEKNIKDEKEELKKDIVKENKIEEKNENVKSGEKGKEFLLGLLKELSLTAEIEVNFNGKDIFFDITGQNLSALIGYRGETLYAIQFLVSVIESREDRSVGKVLLNIDHYKEQREIQLSELAIRQAERAKEFGRIIKLEPMNSYERKIIHTALQNDENIDTTSEGEEPNRFIVITPKNAK